MNLGTSCAEWVSRLVQIPSVNPLHAGPSCGVAGEHAIAVALADWFTSLGASEVVLDDVVDGRPNVYGFFSGRTGRLTVLDIHIDTVTVENMTDPPFDGRIADGYVWGRGALDTKASMGVICALLESWSAQGLRPESTLLVVGSVGEEAGGLLGAARFRSWATKRGLDIDELVICEPTDCAPIHGHKGAVGLRITVVGESAHTSTPEQGKNAIYAAARVIAALEAHHHELVAEVAQTAVGTGTLAVSMINGGIAPNVVPDRCTITVGRRLAPFEVPRQAYDRIESVARAASSLSLEVEPVFVFADGQPGAPAFYQSPDSNLVRTFAEAAGTQPATAPFGTNALRYDGFATTKIVFGPGNIEDAHKPTERVAIADLERTAQAFTAWLRPG